MNHRPMMAMDYDADWWDRCPNCGSFDIVGQDPETRPPNVTQSVTCNTCEKSWVEVYRKLYKVRT